MKHILQKTFIALFLSLVSVVNFAADDFTVERAVNLSQLDSWADISKFQWQEIDHAVMDNGAEMEALKEVFRDPAPKDTAGFYKQIFDARDNQYIVLRAIQTPRRTTRKCSPSLTTPTSCRPSATTRSR